jgi:hypothetical protein
VATIINTDYRNAIVGVITHVSTESVVLVECDDPFVHYTVPVIIDNRDEAMFLVDQLVCIHDRIVRKLN